MQMRILPQITKIVKMTQQLQEYYLFQEKQCLNSHISSIYHEKTMNVRNIVLAIKLEKRRSPQFLEDNF